MKNHKLRRITAYSLIMLSVALFIFCFNIRLSSRFKEIFKGPRQISLPHPTIVERDERLDPKPFLLKMLKRSDASDNLEIPKSARDAAGLRHSLKMLLRHRIGSLSKVHSVRDKRLSDVFSTDNQRIIVESVLLETQPGLWMNGFFIVPEKTNKPKLPALICVPGHGCLEDIVGIAPVPADSSYKFGYQNKFALTLAKEGYAVFALEQVGFGKRQFKENFLDKPRQTSCNKPGKIALACDSSLLSLRVNDVSAAVDFLISRKEVDASKIGVVGISAGGTSALVAAALDSRISLTAISGALISTKESFANQEHCLCDYVPGLLSLADIPVIAGSISPRVLIAEHGVFDATNPIKGFRRACDTVRSAFKANNASSNFVSCEFEGGHEFEISLIFDELKRRLQLK